jgi:pyridoxamine 5'-phosphate oxidase
MTKIADLRKNYTQAGLLESDIVANPYQQFKLWFEQAVAADILEPNAMTVATVTDEGKPSARVAKLSLCCPSVPVGRFGASSAN